jgi:fibronectin-binding autotransporter adhesin
MSLNARARLCANKSIQQSNRRKYRPRLLALAAAASAVSLPAIASAQTSQWIGATSNWNTASNWAPSGVPGASDIVNVTNTLGQVQTITYNYTAAPVTLNTLTLDALGSGTASEILSMSANTLSLSGNEYVGNTGTGDFNQSGGTQTVGTWLFIAYGGGKGTYALSGTATLVTPSISVGYIGTGTFIQSGGTVTDTDFITVGDQPGGNGTYTLSLGTVSTPSLNLAYNAASGTLAAAQGLFTQSGGSLTVSGIENVGFGGVATYNQSGGSNTILGGPNTGLYVATNSGSTGTYNLSGTGTLAVTGPEFIGNSGLGTFNQTGGTNTVSLNLLLGHNTGSTGMYELSGNGSLAGGGFEYVGFSGSGIFNQSGGTNSTTGSDPLYVGYNGGSTGTYTLSGSGTLSAIGTDSNGISEYIGYSGKGAFIQTSGTNYAPGWLSLGYNNNSTGTYTLSGTGQLTENFGNEFIGGGGDTAAGGTGIFNQSGGTNNANGNLFLGYNTNSTGFYNLSATGTLYSGSEIIGEGGAGNFNQTGGANINDGVEVGNTFASTSSYVLSGTGQLVAFDEFIGTYGPGTFTQSGGTNSVGTYGFYVGDYAPGTYTLSGSGSLSAASTEYVGDNGNGIFNQTGGVNIMTGASGLGVGQAVGFTGTYSLSGTGAILASLGEAIGFEGVGTFNQTGGTNSSPTGFLSIASNVGATGSYTLSAGPASFGGNVYVGGEAGAGGAGVLSVSGSGVFTTGGTLTAYNTPGTGITLSGGTINTAALDFNGVPSLFTWTGGTLNLTSSVTWDSGAAATTTSDAFQNSLALGSGQTLIVTGNETIGGTGSFTLELNSGSTHYVTGGITLAPTGVLEQNNGSSLYYSTFTMAGGAEYDTMQNQGEFIYQSGQFNGRLINEGTVQFGAFFTLGNGVENDTAMAVSTGQTLSVNGAGLDNLGYFSLSGGTISGNGVVLNDFSGQMDANGVINNAFTNDGIFTVQGVLRFGSTAVNNGTLNGNGDIIGNFSNGAAGTIDLNSTLPLDITSPWTNSGLVLLQDGQISGETITNSGTIEGFGAINSPIGNYTGAINATGGLLTITSANNVTGTAGQIQAGNGGTVQFSQGLGVNNGLIELAGGTFNNNNQPLTNASTGNITGYGSISTGGLNNSGAFTLGGGSTASSLYGNVNNFATITFAGNTFVYGNITNAGTDNVILAGTAPNQFYGAFSNTGTLTVVNSASGYLYGAYNGTGPIKNNGTLYVQANSISGNVSGSGTLILGEVGLPTHFQLLSTTGTSTEGSLTIGAGSTLDISNNTFDINYGASADPISTIVTYLAGGYDGGNWAGTFGIVSSTAAAGGLTPKLSIGYADGDDAYDLARVAGLQPNQIVVKYTLAGDANLDGVVNFADLLIVAQNFNKTGEDWVGGNFIYNTTGLVNFSDLLIVAQNFNKALTPAGSSSDGIGGNINSLDAEVPEPGAFALLIAGGAGLLPRRRRAGNSPAPSGCSHS